MIFFCNTLPLVYQTQGNMTKLRYTACEFEIAEFLGNLMIVNSTCIKTGSVLCSTHGMPLLLIVRSLSCRHFLALFINEKINF